MPDLDRQARRAIGHIGRRRAQAALAAIGVLLALGLGCQRGRSVARRSEGRFGEVTIYPPAPPPRGMVFLFSDSAGWDGALDGAARALAARGAAVVGVDLPSYLRGLAASNDGCHYLLSEIEDLSKRLQHELAFPRYASPVLAGIGAGGTLAYAALAQSPAATVAGAVSIDPAPSLGTRVPLCPGAPSRKAAAGGYRYGARRDLPGWWVLSPPGAVARSLQVIATPGPSDGTAPARLVAAVEPHLWSGDEIASASRAGAAPAALPLVEIPSAHPGPLLAVFFSGDGGWRDLDKTIGELLAREGMPVVGIDSLRYFWRARTPEEVAADLDRIIARYAQQWQSAGVVLIGYSFGADVLPFAYNRLPPSTRDRVVQVSLLGVEPHAAFEFHVTGWLGLAPGANAPAVLPEVLHMPLDRLQCFYGADEPDTLCRDPVLAAAEIIRTSGGHHFDGDYPKLARIIHAGARARGAAAGVTSSLRDHPPHPAGH